MVERTIAQDAEESRHCIRPILLQERRETVVIGQGRVPFLAEIVLLVVSSELCYGVAIVLENTIMTGECTKECDMEFNWHSGSWWFEASRRAPSALRSSRAERGTPLHCAHHDAELAFDYDFDGAPEYGHVWTRASCTP